MHARENRTPFVFAGARRVYQVVGGPHRRLVAKVRNLGRVLASLVDGRERARRLERLRALHLVDEVPTSAQLFTLTVDMFRFYVLPNADKFYRNNATSGVLQTVLRILDDPATMVDPLGLSTERDTIVSHLLHVQHASTLYDLQLLQIFPDGLERLEREIVAVLDDTHERAAPIKAVVDDPAYHPRLLAEVRQLQVDPTAEIAPRSVEDSEEWSRLEGTFGTLRGALGYACTLPKDWVPGLWHVASTRAPSFLAGAGPGAGAGAAAHR
jgi:hypothetical protein